MSRDVPSPREDDGYGEEFMLVVPSGTLRSSSFPDECDYVRIVDHQGKEVAYWSCDEWAEDPMLVMGAILGATQLGEVEA